MSNSIVLKNPSVAGAAWHTYQVLKNTVARKITWLGPAFIASVAYVDPGNFAANIASGAQCGYSLLWVLLWGNLIAILVQTLSCRLGIFTGDSLAKNCGKHFPAAVKIPLWITSELMSVATDLAEVLGAGLGITLVFHTTLFPSCLVAGLLSFLPFLKKQREQRFIERLMLVAVLAIGAAFAYELVVARPDWTLVTRGTLVPTLHGDNTLMIAASMLGATVMPHVIFLHSGLMKGHSENIDPDERYRFAIADNFIALNFAWLINASMVITFAAAYKGMSSVTPSIESATQMISPLFGNLSGLVFGIALIVAGLGSTTVGSMAGQVILDGFFEVSIPVWCRRALTLVPCLLIIHVGFDTTTLLVLSQAALSLALPFTMVPLIMLNASKKVLGDKCIKGTLLIISAIAAGLIVVLNISLLFNLGVVR